MKKGKIYQVVNDIDEKVYVGSTFQKKLSSRMGNHRGKAKKGRGSKFYQHMNTIGIEHFSIKLIKNVEVNNKEELEKEEFIEIQKIAKEKLLNMNTIQGKHCAEHNKKVVEARRALATGSIFQRTYKNGGYDTKVICFSWQDENGKQHRKQWSTKKFGEAKARQLAKAEQDKIYPQNN